MEERRKKLNLNRVPMPKQPPETRRLNFEEVALGYTDDLARLEAERCLECKKPTCVRGCPVMVDIPDFIGEIKKGNPEGALKIIKNKNSLPGICGRVCPQELQCEKQCILAKKGAPVAIGRLERYVADWELHNGRRSIPEIAPSSGRRVAVVGSGPAGLTCAADLARMGHSVTIFEALHVAGGVLVYGIPEFRLPKRIVQAEVAYVASLGVEIRLDAIVGRTVQVDELLSDGYDAVFLGIGAGAPIFLDVPGKNLNGIYSANEFLTRINLMKAYLFPEYDTPIKVGRRVAVIGGGNVAMDASRCAVRMGAQEVFVVYRRSEKEMPARHEEIENAQEEGVIFKVLTTPVRFIGDEHGWVRAMECVQMELGDPDESGRRRPVPKPGSEFILEVDTVIMSLGNSPNPLVPQNTPGLETTRWGTIVADENGRTSKRGVWAGGDIVTGAATVISAMGAGKRAALDIDAYLKAL
ncbi:NADPH-dependent glutamate synthase [Thermodesulforhabdus norvegica]|uniref:Glutamate synthase (NADPH/NADH) small chain n=1 Tax=Thermodesulforhabdus norvegica TaxID=39841 RepID=A0A1I4W0X2_9BACT|nr:NADPH-dependent glutamate synthase [Thermodesulforhabdus norvegica]SFN07238.1 glutamate synthase (NADPH/NADH) small chain [Thermodesulforhabdus norvegica]